MRSWRDEVKGSGSTRCLSSRARPHPGGQITDFSFFLDVAHLFPRFGLPSELEAGAQGMSGGK
jgi:hypothetical protein